MINRSQARSDLCEGYSGVLTSVKMRCSRRTHYHRSFSLFLRLNARCILSKAVLERECRISVKANGQPVLLSASALSQTELFFRSSSPIFFNSHDRVFERAIPLSNQPRGKRHEFKL
jgi:hypothetical protein